MHPISDAEPGAGHLGVQDEEEYYLDITVRDLLHNLRSHILVSGLNYTFGITSPDCEGRELS